MRIQGAIEFLRDDNANGRTSVRPFGDVRIAMRILRMRFLLLVLLLCHDATPLMRLTLKNNRALI